MKMSHFIEAVLLANLLGLGTTQLMLGKTAIEIDGDSPITNEVISSGEIKVSVDYVPYDFKNPELSSNKNLSYQIFYNNRRKLEERQFTQYTGEIFLADLDNNGTDEVIVKVFSGGAHCCTNHLIYTWKNNQFTKTQTGELDGNGGYFKDIEQDKKYEFITYDNSFLYQFSSYAGSFAPSLIFKFEQGNFIEVTRNYPKILRTNLQKMYEALRQRQSENGEINGILAGYVAQKILLGESEEGWEFMLANYDQSSDWGLDIYDRQGNRIGKHPNFPAALKMFLRNLGYV